MKPQFRNWDFEEALASLRVVALATGSFVHGSRERGEAVEIGSASRFGASRDCCKGFVQWEPQIRGCHCRRCSVSLEQWCPGALPSCARARARICLTSQGASSEAVLLQSLAYLQAPTASQPRVRTLCFSSFPAGTGRGMLPLGLPLVNRLAGTQGCTSVGARKALKS